MWYPRGQSVSLSQPEPDVCLESGKNPTRAGIVWIPFDTPANPRLPRIFQLPPERVLTGVDGAQLAPEGSGVGALGLGSGGAGLDDEALAAAQAVGVSVRVGIVLGQPGAVDLVLNELRGNLRDV